ncbi:hypothetical protein [Pontibacter flavimaris]|uniref:Rieske domain-containing protein n=1 Tax=Pontibacter flavimaris TaxID=1797110 RepID=A0A1Q5PD60_9BACT|nr:hypothetical protein [Pontibacter flavimaris]OKL40154.1 hypothetical protein A3841_17580 [Pontibacter flavimaris]
MKSNLRKTFTYSVFILALGALAACQPTETGKQEEAVATAAPAAPNTAVKRAAPEFFVIPEDMARKRVWICEDGVSDIFHVKHDCPILVQCKGKGSFRNLVLPRAIEEYGRYNCQECSKELDIIFDRDAVREIGG